MLLFLVVILIGMCWASGHGNLRPIMGGGLDPVAVVVCVYGWLFGPMFYRCLAVLVANSVSNSFLNRRCKARKWHQAPALIPQDERRSP